MMPLPAPTEMKGVVEGSGSQSQGLEKYPVYTRTQKMEGGVQVQAEPWEVPEILEELLESLELSGMQLEVEESEKRLETLEEDE